MKVTAFILAILILILSCIPCADMEGMPQVKTGDAKETCKVDQHQQKDDNDIDLCSPLCHCACCAGFSIIHKPVTIPCRLIEPERPIYTEYLTADLIDISLPIWQPPQLV